MVAYIQSQISLSVVIKLHTDLHKCYYKVAFMLITLQLTITTIFFMPIIVHDYV